MGLWRDLFSCIEAATPTPSAPRLAMRVETRVVGLDQEPRHSADASLASRRHDRT
jgi:hypothetical protein